VVEETMSMFTICLSYTYLIGVRLRATGNGDQRRPIVYTLQYRMPAVID